MAAKLNILVPKSLVKFEFPKISNFRIISSTISKMYSISPIVCLYYFLSTTQSGKFTYLNWYSISASIGNFHCKYQTFNIEGWMRPPLIVTSIDFISNASPPYTINSFMTYIWFSHGISIASKSIYAQVEFECLRIELSVAPASLENASKFSLSKYSSCQPESVRIIMQLFK